MKNYIFLLFAGFLFLSCQKKADDIKLNSLTSACDYVDAMTIVLTEMVELNDKYPNEIKWVLGPVRDGDTVISNEHTKRFEALQIRIEEISQAAYKKYTRAEFKECDNLQGYAELYKRLK